MIARKWGIDLDRWYEMPRTLRERHVAVFIQERKLERALRGDV